MAAPKFYMPTISSSDSPKFVVTPQGFKTFFFDVKNLASRAGLNAEDTIEWACLYAGEEGARWESLECMKDPANPPTLKDFKDAVFARYPSLANDQRYSMDDLRRIQSMFRDRATMTVAELATYTQDFSDCSEWLISKGKLWALERSDAFIAGLPVPVENFTRLRRVAMGLIKDPVSGWKYDEICKAALLVVSSDLADSPPVPDAYVQPVALGNRASYPLPPSHFPPSGQSPPIYGYIAVSDVNRVMGQGAAPPSRQSQFAPQAPPPGGGLNNPPRWDRQDRGDRQNRASYPPNPPPRGSGPQHPPPSRNNPYQQGPPPPPRDGPSQDCMFCSSPDHYVRECPVAHQYIGEGKVRRNQAGKIVLPNGDFVPRWGPGQNMRERVDQLQSSGQRSNGPVVTNFVETADEIVYQIDMGYSPPTVHSTPAVHSDDDSETEIQVLEAKLESLREAQVFNAQKVKEKREGKRVVFDGVNVPGRKAGPSQSGPKTPPTPNIYAQSPPPKRSDDHEPSTSGKPGARATDKPPRRPQGPMKPVEMAPKPPAEPPKFQLQSKVETASSAAEIARRALSSSFEITILEAAAMSPDFRKELKDQMTSRRVATNLVELDTTDDFLTSFGVVPEPDFPAPQLHQASGTMRFPTWSPRAVENLGLRVIFPSFGRNIEPECVLDGGSQICVMRYDLWKRLGVPMVANKALPMKSANGGTIFTLGLVEDLEVKLGPISLKLQVQVVDGAPFEVLLGRPFFDVTSCTEISHHGGKHHIQITDPSTGVPYTFPTETRDGPELSQPAVNFP
jgi:hypothetical protein